MKAKIDCEGFWELELFDDDKEEDIRQKVTMLKGLGNDIQNQLVE